MRDQDCVFCRIVAGDAPASIVYRDQDCVAFLDINPVNEGHLLVIPTVHATSLSELAPEALAKVAAVAQACDQALRSTSVRCEGVNLFLADGTAAGQDVMHVHMHVIPRYVGDGSGFRRGRFPGRATHSELDRIAAEVAGALGQ